MIIKKIIILLCIGITSLSYSMEKIAKDRQRFNKKLDRLIKLKFEQPIIDHLKIHPDFILDDMEEIFKAISEAKLKTVLDYLIAKYDKKLEKEKFINFAISARHIEKIKELTDFELHFEDGKLLTKYFLENPNISIEVMDAIFLHDKINYLLSDGQRYLAYRIDAEELKETLVNTILSFIKSASVEELNAQDSDGNTALHIATARWEQAEGRHKNEIKEHLTVIIQVLLEHGANPEIENNQNAKPVDSMFFERNVGSFQWWRATYEFKELIKTKDQAEIKRFLIKNSGFASGERYEIFYRVFLAELNEIRDFIVEKYHLTEKNLATLALQNNDYETLKKVIQFNTFVNDNGVLDIDALKSKLTELGIDSNVIDRIIKADKINYQNNQGDRYLQKLISESYLDSALNFIKSASLDELNSKDNDGNTALHVATLKLNECTQSGHKMRAVKLREIIKELIKHGADVNIANNDNLSSITPFLQNEKDKKCVAKWQSRYKELVKYRKPRSKSYFGTKTKIALAAVSVVGIGAVVYFGNQYLNSKSLNNSINVK